MSYNTDLQNNNTSLQEILATINNLPEAGSGGGTSGGTNNIEVCSLKFLNNTSGIIIYYTKYENNTIATIREVLTNSPSVISNVICNSLLAVYLPRDYSMGATGNFISYKEETSPTDMVNNRHVFYQLSSIPNETVQFSITKD